MIPLLFFLALLLVTPGLCSAQTRPFTVAGEVFEALYFTDKVSETTRVGSIAPIKVSTDFRPTDLKPFIDSFVKEAEKTTSVGRSDMLIPIGDLSSAFRKVVIYEMVNGVKGVTMRPPEYLDTGRLDVTRVYGLLPLVSSYSCAVTHLRYGDGVWKLTDEHDQNEVAGVRCSPKQKGTWTVAVDVDSVSGFHRYEEHSVKQRLTSSAYDEIDALAQTIYPNLRTYREELQNEQDWIRKNPPEVQARYAKKLSFILKIRLSK